MKHVCSLVVLLAVHASSAAAEDFPEGSSEPTAAQLESHLSGKTFTITLKNGVTWRIEHNTSGNFFIDTSTGGKASGTWTAENGRVCSQVQGREATCNGARIHDGQVLLRRADGEIIRYVPR